jgi:3-dehydroquinate synthase
MITLIKRSCEIKKTVIEIDEREGGLRKILNFGHTLGHALEAVSFKSSRPLLHGEAISIGMVGEAHISTSMGMISPEVLPLLEHTLTCFDLPTRYQGEIDLGEIRGLISADKKNVAGKVKWTLLSGIGKASYDVEVDEGFFEEAMKYVLRAN